MITIYQLLRSFFNNSSVFDKTNIDIKYEGGKQNYFIRMIVELKDINNQKSNTHLTDPNTTLTKQNEGKSQIIENRREQNTRVNKMTI